MKLYISVWNLLLTRSDNKVMRLVPKKVLFYLFINYNMVTFKVHPLCLHTSIPAVLPSFVPFLERSLWDVIEDLRFRLLDVFFWLKMASFHCRFYFFKLKKKVARCEVRWVRRLQHHRNAFGCQKLRSTAHAAVVLWDSRAPSWYKFYSSTILRPVSNERFPGSCSLRQQSIWLLIFDQIEQFLLSVLRCRLSVLLMVNCCAAHLQQGFCL